MKTVIRIHARAYNFTPPQIVTKLAVYRHAENAPLVRAFEALAALRGGGGMKEIMRLTLIAFVLLVLAFAFFQTVKVVYCSIASSMDRANSECVAL